MDALKQSMLNMIKSALNGFDSMVEISQICIATYTRCFVYPYCRLIITGT